MIKSFLRISISISVLLISILKFGHFSPVLASDCTPPGVSPHVWSSPGPNPGQVTIYWDGVSGANRYALAYGTSSHSYMYGADRIGEEVSRSYTVSSLSPGTTYYFAVSAARDNCAGGFSMETSSVAMPGNVSEYSQMQTNMSGLTVSQGSELGSVDVHWNSVSEATNYHLVYGKNMNVNEYGALNIGSAGHFHVNKLVPGERYYFSIVAVRDGHVIKTIGPVSAWATGEVENKEEMPVIKPVQMTEKPAASGSLMAQPTVKPTTMPTKSPTKAPIPTTAPINQPQTSTPTYFIP